MTIHKLKIVSLSILAAGLCFGDPLPVSAQPTNKLLANASELAQLPPDEIVYELGPFLSAWAARSEGHSNWKDLAFSETTLHDQAETIVSIIEANHQNHNRSGELPEYTIRAVLIAALAISNPNEVFDSSELNHPLLEGTDPIELRLALGNTIWGDDILEATSLYGAGLGDVYRAALKPAWMAYSGRQNLDGMSGEEAPNDLERWLFDVRNKETLCEVGEAVAWSCPDEKRKRTLSICMSANPSAEDVYAQYRVGNPGNIELAFPDKDISPKTVFRKNPSGIRGTELTFSNNDYDYTLEMNPQDYMNALFVSKKGKGVFNMACEPTHNHIDTLDLYLSKSKALGLKPVIIEPDKPNLDICPTDFGLTWACHKPGQPVQGLCTSRGQGPRHIQFKGNITLPSEPMDVTEVSNIWVNETPVLQITDGPQSITIGQGDGVNGTDAWVQSEFNHNPERPYDCHLLVDYIDTRFTDLIPCVDRFNSEACPATQILPHSNARMLMPHELRGMSAAQLELAQTEILVRHGQTYYNDAETAHFSTRSWTSKPIGDVPINRLTDMEKNNYFLLKEMLQMELDTSLAQNRLPAAWGHWEAKVVDNVGKSGRLHGSDHRLRFVPDEKDSMHWIYLPRQQEYYKFWPGEGQGDIEPVWRAPWLLPTEVLESLNVKVTGEVGDKDIGERLDCFVLSGTQNENQDYKFSLSGEICLTPDGIPVRSSLSGQHNLEGGDEPMSWAKSFQLKSIYRGMQPESLFTPPDLEFWNRPG